MDFQADIRSEVMKWLPYDRADARLTACLTTLPTLELASIFFNWLYRLIHAHPREVFKSKQFICRWVPPREQVYLDRIIAEIEAGNDLGPRLSRRVVRGFVKSTPVTSKFNFIGGQT
jgi:hypothetical protein